MDRKKIILIFGAALLSATLLTWFLYSKTVAPQEEKTVTVLAASRDMPTGTRLGKADLKAITLPEKDMPGGAITDNAAAVDRVLLYPVSTNEPVTANKLTNLSGAEGLPATIEPGKRAISVPFTDATGVAGLVQPRSRVDVLFTRTGSMTEALTTTILEDVQVLSIGRTTEVQTVTDPRAPRPQSQTATLLVTPEEARKLELAKNQGRISLALRNPLDRSVSEDLMPATAADLDPSLRGARRGRMPNIRDRAVWDRLTGEAEEKPKVEEKKEPPKPKIVVDVYRGDKHVQEIFQ